MFQKLGGHIANALERAAAADRRAADADDPEFRLDNERMAQSWRHLARCYQFVEGLERFLLDRERNKNAIAPTPPDPI